MHLGSELQPVLYQLLQIYPRGVVPDSDYWALLAVLQEDMSIEALSKVVAQLVNDELVVVENHAAESVSVRRPAAEDLARVRVKLRDVGWEPEEA